MRYKNNRGHERASFETIEITFVQIISSFKKTSFSNLTITKERKHARKKKQISSLTHCRRICLKSICSRPSLLSSSSPLLSLQSSNSSIEFFDRKKKLKDFVVSIVYILDAYIFSNTNQRNEDEKKISFKNQESKQRKREKSIKQKQKKKSDKAQQKN